MSKRIIIILLLVLFTSGCGAPKNTPVAIKIGAVNISPADFESAFEDSPFSSEDTSQSRKQFLDTYITRILILTEAEKIGLDKDPVFLKTVETFWQQSLIKLILDYKIKELSMNIRISDRDINDYYNSHKETDYKDRELASVYDSIKWLISNQKQKEAVNSWLTSLRDHAKIDLNYALLKIKE